MSARLTRLLPVVFALATVARATTYPVRHMDPSDALMALNVRVPAMSQDCHFTTRRANDTTRAGFIGVLEITCGSEATYAQIKTALEAIDAPPPTHRFHVAVLAASRKEGPDPELPSTEIKALNDFKKVMTFKSFQMEAETILQSNDEAQTQLGGNYAVDLSIGRNGTEAISVRKFKLRAAQLSAAPGGGQSYYPTYIETSFAIKKGETIVLGTSMSDQQARVVLVTALP